MEPATQVDSGLSHPLARPVLLFGWAAVLIAALVGSLLPPVDQWSFGAWFTIVAIAIDFVVVTVRRPGRLSWPQVVFVVGISFAALLVLGSRGIGGSVESTAYAIGYLNMAVALLIMRGHSVIGAVASAVLLIRIAWLGVLNGRDTAGQLESLAQPLATPIAFFLLAWVARTVEGKRSQVVELELQMVAQTDAVRSQSADEHRTLSEIPDVVEPILRRIAAGEPLTADFHAEVIAADEIVRNHLRRDLPYHVGFLKAMDAARDRGIVVRVIGNEDPWPRRMSDTVADQLIVLLSADAITDVTIRFLPSSRGGAVTALIEGPGGMRRYEFSAAGILLREPS